MKNNKYTTGDIFWKIKEKIFDYFRLVYWRLVMGKIGKGSFIKDGMRIVGNPKRIKIGKNFKIWQNCHLSVQNGEIEFGDNGLLGIGSLIVASEGKVTIGNGVAIAPRVMIFSYSHDFSAGKNINDSSVISEVIIEDNVLIGAGAVILPGVRIGKGSRVAAGSLVINSVKENNVVGGVPAKKLYEYSV
jgi:acetyltransferase-like isoleucine patch superfamily enzyme